MYITSGHVFAHRVHFNLIENHRFEFHLTMKIKHLILCSIRTDFLVEILVNDNGKISVENISPPTYFSH